MRLSEEKKKLRLELLKIRNALSLEEYRQKSDAIHARLKQIPEVREAGIIHSYISMGDRKEADTLHLIRDFLSEGKKIMVPVIHKDTFRLDHSYLNSVDDLVAHKWRVLEPKEMMEAKPSDADLILVPMVGADERKNRIGYGKGFYDRFLSENEKLKIGICFECCLKNHIPVEPFDVPLDMIVTEKRVIR
jgi:5-formyltetrahydrofolate cyclo-ligase